VTKAAFATSDLDSLVFLLVLGVFGGAQISSDLGRLFLAKEQDPWVRRYLLDATVSYR
jgi:hypothetical protein